MNNVKPVIFISHISEEAEIAIKLKQLIEKSFLNSVDVFVSSDANSSGVGDGWLDRIKENLSKTIYAIILCSPKSISRPWINFEAGAAWIKQIKIAPLCHSGALPNQLPIPLTTFNGVLLNNETGLNNLFLSLSKEINLSQPTVDFKDFINFIEDFQIKYLFTDKLFEIFEKLNEYSPGFLERAMSTDECFMMIPQSEDQFVKNATAFLHEHRIATIKMITPNVSIVNLGSDTMSRTPYSSRYAFIKDIKFDNILLSCGFI
ncbi:TPA: toll/interleukin-1 receptor domain-containing protein [Klebsiella variicola]|uniref:toll/interleukin-1 receptor domain-containing protein n=1 Tax=Klebsiella TaxID=570 RepID=UPI002B05D927|nr:toll/interleukin-1 receptor domain-containing protein [Klebsiella quasipneumoniae]